MASCSSIATSTTDDDGGGRSTEGGGGITRDQHEMTIGAGDQQKTLGQNTGRVRVDGVSYKVRARNEFLRFSAALRRRTVALRGISNSRTEKSMT